MLDGTLNAYGFVSHEVALHRKLAAFNRERFDPALPTPAWRAGIDRLANGLREEGDFLEERRAGVAARAAEAPRDADGFVRWFEALELNGPGQHDALFPWLAETASLEQDVLVLDPRGRR